MCLKNNFNEYKHFVSLGANCYVAQDLKSLGLRNCSYPFDWLFTDDFSGVISAIENDYIDVLSYDVLYQHQDHRARYYNDKYCFSFFHDFSKYQSLKKQISSVQTKYNRRISRFKKDICEPTVFFRYIISKKDVEFITDNYEKIDSLIKSFCSSNKIIYISHIEAMRNLPIEVYITEKDTDDWITRTPLTKNDILGNALKNMDFKNREANKEYSNKRKNKFSLERVIRRCLKKEYIHSRIHK